MNTHRFAVVAAVLLGLLLSGCQVVVIPWPVTVAPAESAETVGALPPAQLQPAGVNAPEVLAQFDAIDVACSSDLTNAQRERGLATIRPFFAGRQVELIGTVFDVRNLGGSFDVIVTLDGSDRDVRMDNLPEAQALALRKGQRVTLAGEVDAGGCWAYVTVVGTLRTD